jgi:uncharacterized protein (TIGR02996 family)
MSLAATAKALGAKGVRATGDGDLSLDAEAFARIARELFATHPLRTVRLWKATGPELVAALARPELATVRALYLTRNRLTDADIEALAHAPHLDSLERIDFGFCGLSGRACAVLAKADPRRFPALRAISLFANKIGAVGVRALATSLLVEQLTELEIGANHAGDEAIAALIAAPAIRNLERLVVERNDAGALAKAALAESKYALRLEQVDGLPASAIVERNAKSAIPYSAPAKPANALAAQPERAATRVLDDDGRGRELVASLAADPSDSNLLAVYADWLQERGDIRGELIALELNRESSAKWQSKHKSLRSKVTRDFEQRFKNKSVMLKFERGVIVHVGAQHKWLLEHGAAIFAREPVQSLYVQSPSAAGMAKLPEIPGMDRVRWIGVTPPTPKLVQAIPWPKLPNLSLSLRLRGRELGAYLALPEIARLRELQLYLSTLAELQTVVTSPALAQLERFSLHDSLGPEAADALLQARWKLTKLHVGRANLESEHARLTSHFGDVLRVQYYDD